MLVFWVGVIMIIRDENGRAIGVEQISDLTDEIEDLLCRKYGFDWREDYIEVSWKLE